LSSTHKTTRRTAIKTGLAAAATSALAVSESEAALLGNVKPKAPGETRVVFLGGDTLHNFQAQEPALRNIMTRAGWKFYSAHDARYITPDLLSDTDLLIIQRWNGSQQGWVPGPIAEEAGSPDGYMSDELEAAIVDNVTNRGMGFMSLHCTIWAMARKKFTELLGIRAIIHGPLQPVHIHNLNQSHPITQGMMDFDLALDENFGVELINKNAVPLYETTGWLDKRHDVGGWCIEQGKGRVVGYLAGHTYFAYEDPSYLPLYSRGAYWAMKKDIPQTRR
jgi:type 1 glutamine amidotransferase